MHQWKWTAVIYTVEPLLADTPNSGHLPYNGQCAMYQLLFLYYCTLKTSEYSLAAQAGVSSSSTRKRTHLSLEKKVEIISKSKDNPGIGGSSHYTIVCFIHHLML